MVELKREELFKLAELTALKLSDKEADTLRVDLENLINYTDELAAIELAPERQQEGNVNTLREDVSRPSTLQDSLLEQAPQRDQTYFVVPQIIDDKESA